MHAFALIAAALAAQAPPAPAPAPAGSTARRPLALDLSGLRTVRPPALVVVPAVANAVEIDATTYIARRGDTIRSVGEATGVGASAIIRANGLQPPYTLHFGQSLLVPGGRYHRVAAGETGIAIAQAYRIGWSRIIDANELVEPYGLRVGQRLVLPGSGRAAATPRSIEARAAAFQISIDDLATGTEPARVRPFVARGSTSVIAASGQAPQRFLWPADGRVVARFGSQGRGRLNQGVDLAASAGSIVRATARGEVAYVGSGVPGFGGLILVRHDGGWISAYGRVDTVAVKKGARVGPGQPIGRVGGDALHFELRRARIAVDPVRYLPARKIS